ncbi:MAG: hypothetical protein GOVbin1753_34 [Prokaryotic dsDNA virus sp.]|nr:MAG: hypothetical protein GOVbin1753_34 [Prokaryotic dsDNA virus sp.]|tara:strand:+ start:6823 stop:7434 length:612 start_codon:yes stop_codon:yes gene_type:complete
MWKEVLKSEFSTSPKKGTSEHGIQITKMYMFLKRYFADEHTPQFKKVYVTLDVMKEGDIIRLNRIIENARRVFVREFDGLLKQGEVLPGAYIDLRVLSKVLPKAAKGGYIDHETGKFVPHPRDADGYMKPVKTAQGNIEFDDERHKELRDLFIQESYEGQRRDNYPMGSRYDSVPASRTIQSFWNQLSRIIKKSNNFYWDEEW